MTENNIDGITGFFDIDPRLVELAESAQEELTESFKRIDRIAEYNTFKVLKAFTKNKVGENALHGTTGYGYNDLGRELLDRVYADSLGAEDALVRHSFVNGTHALSTALFGVLRPGDRLVMCTGSPYDTLEGVIGLREQGGIRSGSLIDFGVEYGCVGLKGDGMPDHERIFESVKGAKVAYIQRSRGYSTRPSYTIDDIKRLVSVIREANPSAVIMVDNCYGEFVDRLEPCDVGADLEIGSLIKNPGGGIASTGGYIAGREELVSLCADRLTCVGMGKEVGASLNQNREMFLGFFIAPQTVASALKTSELACMMLNKLGFRSLPMAGLPRADIISSIEFGSVGPLTSFIRGVQKGAPIDSYVTPEAWDMPGYESKVIMAAGAFTSGASIEFSADAPIREPYAAWLQGGITYPSGKAGVLIAIQNMLDEGTLTL